ncbi:MAG TPA: hypothetical protein VK864_14800 [Longimicrobiales bacterium]|nr:hypothetical protein [Longimicrobiales bacterium]
MRHSILSVAGLCLLVGCSDQPRSDGAAADSIAAPTGVGGLPDSAFVAVPGERIGVITAATTEADLVATFGQAAIRRDEIGIGEGQTEWGTRLFPDTPDQLDILWAGSFACPKHVSSSRVGGRWHTVEGVRVGSPLPEVEQANGKRFTLLGFEWDYGGYVSTFNQGKLDGLGLRFGLTEAVQTSVSKDELRGILGDRTLSSADSVVRKAQPIVTELSMAWPAESAPCPKAAPADTQPAR